MSTELELTNALQRAVTIDDDHMRRLRERLAADADAEHMLDIGYRTVDSPVGNLLLAATETGLVRVAYASEDHDRVLESLSSHISLASCAILLASTPPQRARRVLRRASQGFGLTLDRRLSTGFRATVLRASRRHRVRATASCEGRRAARSSEGCRAVGTACATNPRRSCCPATASCGRTAAWAAISGLDAKATLLELEAAG